MYEISIQYYAYMENIYVLQQLFTFPLVSCSLFYPARAVNSRAKTFVICLILATAFKIWFHICTTILFVICIKH